MSSSNNSSTGTPPERPDSWTKEHKELKKEGIPAMDAAAHLEHKYYTDATSGTAGHSLKDTFIGAKNSLMSGIKGVSTHAQDFFHHPGGALHKNSPTSTTTASSTASSPLSSAATSHTPPGAHHNPNLNLGDEGRDKLNQLDNNNPTTTTGFGSGTTSTLAPPNPPHGPTTASPLSDTATVKAQQGSGDIDEVN